MARDPELPRFAGLNALALEGWQCGSGLRSRAVRTWFPSQHPMKVLHFVCELRAPTPVDYCLESSREDCARVGASAGSTKFITGKVARRHIRRDAHGNPHTPRCSRSELAWVPAFAGMTTCGMVSGAGAGRLGA